MPDKAELLDLQQQQRPGFEFVGGTKAWSRPVNSLTQAGKSLRRALELSRMLRKCCPGFGLTCCLNPPKPTWSLGPRDCALPAALAAPTGHALCHVLAPRILSMESHFTGWGNEAIFYTATAGVNQMAQQEKARGAKPAEFSSQNTPGGRREPLPPSCPLIVLHCNTCPSPNHI